MRKPNAIGELLRQLVAEKAATPDGFAFNDAKHLQTQYTQKHCRRQVALGLLFKASVNPMLVRHFLTAQAARQFELSNSKAGLIPKKQTIHIGRQPYSPPAPRADAIPVYTDQTRYSSRPFVDLRAVSVPRQRIGQAGFSMTVGGAA